MDTVVYDQNGKVYKIKGDPKNRIFNSYDEANKASQKDEAKSSSESEFEKLLKRMERLTRKS
jgi:hypothetical protein